ncbi:MAG TPA: CHASE3 domain-containing protein [Steroidobacteraceae bacterium]|nr:CHASE3 domain-containing protein [Steroidobacteraceae bacterium]
MLEFNRRYVLLPTLLAIALVLTAFHFVNQAQNRLSDTTLSVQEVMTRRSLLGRFLRLMLDAETGQRGYLLTHNDMVLETYRNAVTQRGPAIEALRQSYAAEPADAAMIETLDRLASDRFAQFETALALQKKNPAAAIQYVRMGAGRTTMNDVRSLVTDLGVEDNTRLQGFKDDEKHDLAVTRVIYLSTAMLNILLVLVAATLISRNIRRRQLDTQRLAEEKSLLESEVRARTLDLTNLSSHLQQVTEQEKGALARELHDELGGLLVAAKMDATWLRRRAGMEDADARLRWERVLSSLDAGVDMKRRVVEQLRPTLLDNMGLFTALRWQLQESCGRAGLQCTESLPEEELPVSAGASIAIFRVAQESMTNILKHAQATSVDMAVDVSGKELLFTIRDNGVGIAPAMTAAPGSHGFLSMRHRVESLGGTWAVRGVPGGRGTEIQMRLPLERILAVKAA